MTSQTPVAIWGVLNVTPDSFSDGGQHLDVSRAVAHAEQMAREGAEVIDVGGESSRPRGRDYGEGASDVPVEEELRRVLPVVRSLVQRGMRVSVDTLKPEVARATLKAGAAIINDISGGASSAMLEAVASFDAELVLMHNRQRGTARLGEVCRPNTVYEDTVRDVVEELEGAVSRAREFGVRSERIWVDPGLGFAKTPTQSATLLAHLPALASLGHRVLVGASRKSFIARLSAPGEPASPAEREGGTAASCALAVLGGAHAIRVHDVRCMTQAARFTEAVVRAREARGGA